MKYRGDYPEIAKLERGESVILSVPADTSPERHASNVHNAVNHFGRTRGRRFKTKLVIHTVGRRVSGVKVTRIHTADELQQLGY
jgi:hypothetical protein